MPFKSRKQQGLFYARARNSPKWKKLAAHFSKATYKGKGGSKQNARRWRGLPVRVKRKKDAS